MKVSHRGRRWTSLAVAALLLAAVVPAPAVAKQDPGGPVQTVQESTFPNCPLRRIDRQLVHCDALTGAGVLAPLWVPEL